ncbi:MAG TPA: GSCFA domain-containing protein [Chryseosolibacter sp.]|nr:GSCFA domain-containing protein [Chryseosolibacter sp.]
MRTFRTDVSIRPAITRITLKTPILTAGSCFADAIGQRLLQFKFPALANPFGVTYNPLSIHKQLLRSIGNDRPEPHTFLKSQQVHLSYDFHSELSALTREELFHKIAHTTETTHHFLKTACWIMLTYGTAWVYERKDTRDVVANCHKVPQSEFSKRLLAESEIVSSFEKLAEELRALNPAARFILTVSPVRHLKDSLELNSVSKSILRTACHALSTRFAHVEYFPGYEIMLDDLRDYRFYKSDMIHPTEDAEEYIWDKFAEGYFDEKTKVFLASWSGILTALNHRPFYPASENHQKFLRDTLKKLELFKDTVNVDEEIAIVEKQLL